MILKCGCKHDTRGNPAGAKFQNETYGPDMRVHTPKYLSPKANPGDRLYRCTVCGQERKAQA